MKWWGSFTTPSQRLTLTVARDCSLAFRVGKKFSITPRPARQNRFDYLAELRYRYRASTDALW